MKKAAILFTLLSTIVFCKTAKSQVALGFGGFVLIPQGQFAGNVPTSGGLELDLGYRIKNTPVMFGTNMNFATYASVTENVYFHEKHYQHYDANRQRSNNMNTYDFYTRVFGFKSNFAIQPYIDGRIGVSHFSTTDEFTDPYRNNNQNTTGSCNSAAILKYVNISRSNALNYGGSIGIQADLPRLFKRDPQFMTVLFDVRGTYLRGASATYQNIKRFSDPYNVRADYTTPTDVLYISFGFKIGFVDKN